MSDGVVRKRGRPKKVVEVAVDGSNNLSEITTSSNGSASSAGTAAPKKKLSESTKKASSVVKKLKVDAEEAVTLTTTTKKRKSPKTLTPEEAASPDKNGVDVAKKDPLEAKTKTRKKKAEPKVGGTSSTTSTPTSNGTSKTTLLNEAVEENAATKSESVKDASSAPKAPPEASGKAEKAVTNARSAVDAPTTTISGSSNRDPISAASEKSDSTANGVKAPKSSSSKQDAPEPLESESQSKSQLPKKGTGTSASTTSGSQSKKSTIPPSKILDALASQESTSSAFENKAASPEAISSQATMAKGASQSTQPKRPAAPPSPSPALNAGGASKMHSTNPLPPPRKGPSVPDAQALKELNARRGKPADIKATKQYKHAARKWTSTIVALPILIYTSYIIYERAILGKEQKRLPFRTDAPPEQPVPSPGMASPSESPKAEESSQSSL